MSRGGAARRKPLRGQALAGDGGAAPESGDAATAAQRLTEALALWRGPAFAGTDVPSVRAEAGRLAEMRLAVLESQAEALLTATSVAALAGPAEILVSRTVKDLLTGSGIAFAARGSHQLTSTAGRWPLFAVAPAD